ncbi:chemotaxis protein CheW [Iningainema tapete]|uniref:Chemotaxis protein CheW n=1 Tax=Iningainema tapete BLCC-T55 TaxID=2748662 RepID=A0A8J6XMG7_9CYAN|nr:chemotaxis protein CheW [Iningainema tapete]MBD2775887.1 chemotaxis protein CheW [Iningainema tapete BLCC-T55]
MLARNSVYNETIDPLGLDPLPIETRSRLLRFSLGQDSALLPLEQIAEIIRVNLTETMPVPEMPECVLGIGNWRGEMLWLVDLNHLVGYPSLSDLKALSPVAIVVQSNEGSVGLVVQQVDDIELHDLQQLQKVAPGFCLRTLLPFVLGVVLEDYSTVLDVTAITQCPLWQIHQKV